MRKDVKAGLVLALVVVVLAGWYHLSDDSASTPIAIDDAADVIVTVKPREMRAPDSTVENSRHAVQDRSSSSRSRHADTTRMAVADPVSAEQLADMVRGNSAYASRRGRTGRVIERPRGADRASEPQGVSARGSSADRRVFSHAATDAGGAHETHVVQRGDTLTGIAQIYYGRAELAGQLLAANPQIVDGDTLVVGTRVKLPTGLATTGSVVGGPAESASSIVDRVSAAHSPAGATNRYVVQEGDSLYAIAARQLGSGERWHEIYELNRKQIGSSPARLKPGQTLLIPGAKSPGTTRQRG